MEKKSGSETEQRSRRKDVSERKASDPAESKDQNEGSGDQPAPKNRRRRQTGDDNNGWMTSGGSGNTSRHAAAVPVPVEEDEPKDSQATR